MGVDAFESFPYEIIWTIFSFFKNWAECVRSVGSVCKTWNALIKQETLFRHICVAELGTLIPIADYYAYHLFWKQKPDLFKLSADTKSRYQYYILMETLLKSDRISAMAKSQLLMCNHFGEIILKKDYLSAISAPVQWGKTSTLCFIADAIRRRWNESVAIVACGAWKQRSIASHFVWNECTDITVKKRDRITFTSGAEILFINIESVRRQRGLMLPRIVLLDEYSWIHSHEESMFQLLRSHRILHNADSLYNPQVIAIGTTRNDSDLKTFSNVKNVTLDSDF